MTIPVVVSFFCSSGRRHTRCSREEFRRVLFRSIQKVVADFYRIRVKDLTSNQRSRNIARPRQIAMSLARELTSHSLPEIGNAFGGRDHTTVMHAVKAITKLRQSNTSISDDYELLLDKISR